MKRWLPTNVTEYRDRHGRRRYRWRKAGHATYHFRSTEAGSEAWLAELAAVTAAPPPVQRAPRHAPGSLDDLAAHYRRTPAWRQSAASTRYTYGRIIDRFLARETKSGVRYGLLPAARLTAAKLDEVLGGMHATPSSANNLRKVLKRMFRLAVKLGWRTDNPVDATDSYRTSGGFHTWTDVEIAQYRAHHPYGTYARLTLELTLNTAARRCNVASLERTMLRRGKFHIEHVKGCEATVVAASAETLAAIKAMPVAGIGHFVITAFGRPFSAAGLGNKMREWCDEAGLPHCTMHGLRKAQSRRLAEAGATSLQGRAITGHKKDATFAYYAEAADRTRLADSAIRLLQNGEPSEPDLANLKESDV